MLDMEIVIRIHNMNEMLLKLQNICPNFGKFSLKRDHSDIYFVSNYPQDLIVRKYDDNTGELIIFEQKYTGNIIKRRFEKLGLPIPMAKEFINIFSQANGSIRIIRIKRCIYLHFLNIFTVIIDNVDGLGDFLIVQAMLYTDEDLVDAVETMTLKLQDVLKHLSVPSDDIVTESFRKMIEQVNKEK